MYEKLKDWTNLQLFGIKHTIKYLHLEFKLKRIRNRPNKDSLRIMMKQRKEIGEYLSVLEKYLDKYDVENWRDLLEEMRK